jgi:hypothetical protein
MGVQKVDDHSCRFIMHYRDDPGGSIPSFLVNWAASSGVGSFVKSMTDACRKYADWRARQPAKERLPFSDGAAGRDDANLPRSRCRLRP